jgi:hypothetical protein
MLGWGGGGWGWGEGLGLTPPQQKLRGGKIYSKNIWGGQKPSKIGFVYFNKKIIKYFIFIYIYIYIYIYIIYSLYIHIILKQMGQNISGLPTRYLHPHPSPLSQKSTAVAGPLKIPLWKFIMFLVSD